jgi:hypothetical protein
LVNNPSKFVYEILPIEGYRLVSFQDWRELYQRAVRHSMDTRFPLGYDNLGSASGNLS